MRKLLRYDAKKDCYIYRPRGFGEYDYMDIPYPEVVSYTENDVEPKELELPPVAYRTKEEN